jgi:iron complex transport system permease protein
MPRLPAGPALLGLCVLLVLAMLGALGFGAVRIPWGDFPGLVWTPFDGREAGTHSVVFWRLRLPRALLAVLVGSTLAVAGAMMQGLFRNPLADPGLVGVSSGAALGAVLMIVLGGHLPVLVALRGGPFLIPAAALGGAWIVTFLILRLGSQNGTTAVATLLLAGIAINAFVGAVIGLCTFLADDAQLRSLNFWMLGSLGAASWGSLALTFPFCLVLLLAAPRTARPLNALSLGEAEAGHLGFHPQRVKLSIILLTSVGVGGCVAQTGMIGFVGLVVPHLLRLLIGPDHRRLLPGSALLGAALLLAADTVARTVVAPAEMPIGIITAAVGAPFFLALLRQQKRRIGWM